MPTLGSKAKPPASFTSSSGGFAVSVTSSFIDGPGWREAATLEAKELTVIRVGVTPPVEEIWPDRDVLKELQRRS